MQNTPKSLFKGRIGETARSPGKLAQIFLIARRHLLAELIKVELCHQGYEVKVFNDSMAAAIAIRQAEPDLPDLIVLDWSISFLSGFDICYYLRSSNKYIPIVALTESGEVRERVAILNAGADDCLSQPFHMEEFLAIIAARFRPRKQEKLPILVFEDLTLNTLTREVHRHNRLIVLTAKEFSLLEYLMLHPRQVLTRIQILEKIWGHDFAGDSNIIEVYIRYLRIKSEAEHEKRLIHTVRSVGYVLRSY
ncbi:MAG: response regulator transcription factor [Cyanobacteria bacterium P01_A01_bin.40]